MSAIKHIEYLVELWGGGFHPALQEEAINEAIKAVRKLEVDRHVAIKVADEMHVALEPLAVIPIEESLQASKHPECSLWALNNKGITGKDVLAAREAREHYSAVMKGTK